LVNRRKRLEDVRAIPLAGKIVDEGGQLAVHGWLSDEIEPWHPLALGFCLRKCCPAPLHGLCHEHQEMPGQATPRWGQRSDLWWVSAGIVHIHLDNGCLTCHFEVTNALLTPVDTEHLEPNQPGPEQRRGPGNVWIVPGPPLVYPPTIRHDVGVEQIGDGHARAVVKGRGKYLVGELRCRRMPGANRT